MSHHEVLALMNRLLEKDGIAATVTSGWWHHFVVATQTSLTRLLLLFQEYKLVVSHYFDLLEQTMTETVCLISLVKFSMLTSREWNSTWKEWSVLLIVVHKTHCSFIGWQNTDYICRMCKCLHAINGDPSMAIRDQNCDKHFSYHLEVTNVSCV